jgi:hypothetical protein
MTTSCCMIDVETPCEGAAEVSGTGLRHLAMSLFENWYSLRIFAARNRCLVAGVSRPRALTPPTLR